MFGPWQTVRKRPAASAGRELHRIHKMLPSEADAAGQLEWHVPVDPTINRTPPAGNNPPHGTGEPPNRMKPPRNLMTMQQAVPAAGRALALMFGPSPGTGSPTANARAPAAAAAAAP